MKRIILGQIDMPPEELDPVRRLSFVSRRASLLQKVIFKVFLRVLKMQVLNNIAVVFQARP